MLQDFTPKRERTIVIVNFGNVEKSKFSLGWQVGIQELANLVKGFAYGKRFLRRFYYGSDYGRHEANTTLEGLKDIPAITIVGGIKHFGEKRSRAILVLKQPHRGRVPLYSRFLW